MGREKTKTSTYESSYMIILCLWNQSVSPSSSSSLENPQAMIMNKKMMIGVVAGVILNLGFLLGGVQSIRFELESGHTKCIAEDIKADSMTVGKYSVVNPNDGYPIPDSHKVTVRVRYFFLLPNASPKFNPFSYSASFPFQVTSAYGNNYHYADRVDSGQFAFPAAEAGDYMACFWVLDHKPPLTLTIDLDWKTGVAAKDWSNVAKKGQVDVSF